MKKLSLILLIAFSSHSFSSEFYDMAVHRGSNVAGFPVESYANIWWQWAYSIPPNVNPVRDVDGSNCHQGQDGQVWFLAGGFGSSKIRRTCSIPYGKHIFFPVINMLYHQNREKTLTCDQVKASAALNNDELLTINVEVDGVSSINPAHYRFSSPECFDLYGMIPKELGAPKVFPSASDGYWVMLKPLSKGAHKIKFSAQYDREKGAYSKMVQDIEYDILVE